MQNKITNLYIAITIVFISLVVLVTFFSLKQKDVVFVNNEKIFNEFRMTKELKLTGEKDLMRKKGKLDSLYAYLSFVKNDEIKSKVIREIASQKEQIEIFQQDFVIGTSDKIWNRINSYLKDYADLKGYDLVIGSQTHGTAFYGNQKSDATNDLLLYINKRYEGNN